MYRIIQTRRIWVSISLVLIAGSLAALIGWGLPLGLDFTGGTLMEVRYDAAPPLADVRQRLEQLQLAGLNVQPSSDNRFIIRAEALSEEKHQEVLTALRGSGGEASLAELRFDSIGPALGTELQRRAVWAVLAVLLAIVLYLTYTFRKVSKPVPSLHYGLAAIIALVHDMILCLGAFAVAAHLVGWRADSLLVTALLTILGFSVHDTIVTFDRVREILRRSPSDAAHFEEALNVSINETVVRSINTSVTAFLALVAIYLFGGESIRPMAFVLVVGIVVGAYSSIFIANPVLLWIAQRKLKGR